MNDIKMYLNLLGIFIFQVIALGILNILFKDPFFTKSNLASAITITITIISFFILREYRKKDKK